MFRGAFVSSVFVVACVAGSVKADERREYRKIEAALHELREARTELEESRVDFRGKKKEAIVAIDDAIGSLKLILGIKGEFKGIDRDKDFYRKHKDHPHLRTVMEDLRAAREEIRDTKDDFKGNKRRALKDVTYAMAEVEDLLRVTKR